MRAAIVLALAPLVSAPLALVPLGASAQALLDAPQTIQRVKRSVVAVGTFQRTRAPAFRFLGTGFAVGDGATIVTNAHVLPQTVDAEKGEAIMVLIPGSNREVQLRPATRGADDPRTISRCPDRWSCASRARSGIPKASARESILFTGYPIGPCSTVPRHTPRDDLGDHADRDPGGALEPAQAGPRPSSRHRTLHGVSARRNGLSR
jgi:hypothetical protein